MADKPHLIAARKFKLKKMVMNFLTLQTSTPDRVPRSTDLESIRLNRTKALWKHVQLRSRRGCTWLICWLVMPNSWARPPAKREARRFQVPIPSWIAPVAMKPDMTLDQAPSTQIAAARPSIRIWYQPLSILKSKGQFTNCWIHHLSSHRHSRNIIFKRGHPAFKMQKPKSTKALNTPATILM